MGFIIIGSNWTYCHLPTYANSKLIRINKSSQDWLFVTPLDARVHWQCQWTSMTFKSRELDQWKLRDNNIQYVESITVPWNTIRRCRVNFLVAKNFIGTGFIPTIDEALLAFSAMFTPLKVTEWQSAWGVKGVKLTTRPIYCRGQAWWRYTSATSS
jgi:hypothetical protein